MTQVTDAAVVKALAHPIRVQILSILEHGVASPTELADQIGSPLPNVSYHVTQLNRLGLISLAREARRRGAVEHYYKLEARPSISDDGWAAAPTIVKEALSQAVIAQIGREIEAAAQEGAFERDDVHLSRLPAVLDDKGFAALAREAERFVGKAREIEEASAKRLERSDEEPIRSRAVVMLFQAAADSDGSSNGDSPARRRGAGHDTKKRQGSRH